MEISLLLVFKIAGIFTEFCGPAGIFEGVIFQVGEHQHLA
ncbi:Uncharacterised protein [Yersinia nurmii]|uniref:Uncharacterized protein n=1 Tax=Yersinia nurmii TaxID=685706 RepID=A0ABM9SJA0_9GAMM|nr:Uncharacterised protein [Yersinia nurmii]